MAPLLSIALPILCILKGHLSFISYEDSSFPNLHPRTFYLSSNQEFQLIQKVLCEGLACPQFSVIHDHPYFIQQRTYEESTFLVATGTMFCNYSAVLEKGLYKINRYHDGHNEREQYYPATLPLLIQVDQYTSVSSNNPWCRMGFTLSSYVPHFWGTISSPTEMSLKFTTLPEGFNVYVHTFTGDVKQYLLREIDLFKRNLDVLKMCYKAMRFYIAIYDIPVHPADSRNELWFEKC